MTKLKLSHTLVLGGLVTALASPAWAHGNKSDTDKNNNHVEQTHDVSGFDEIEIVGVYILDVKMGPEFKVFTSGHADDVKDMEVYVKDGRLFLSDGEKKTRIFNKKKRNDHGVEVEIVMPSLTTLEITGVGTGEFSGIDADDFKIDIAGVGDLEFEGRCGRLEASISGVGNFDAEGLKCEDAVVDMSGVGEISIYASESIDADASGIGEVEVYGNPKSVKKSKNFLSKVKIK